MATIAEILSEKGIQAVTQIRSNLGATGTDATGATSQSLQFTLNQYNSKLIMQITGRPYFMTVETGRKPTPDKGPSRGMIDNIKKWMAARGLDENAAWAIATKINDKGSALWRSGGRKDIVSNVINDAYFESIGKQVLEDFGNTYLDRFLNDLKNQKNVRISGD